MPEINQPPESYRLTYSWKTDILESYDGTEQRVAIRQNPRQSFEGSYLEDSDTGIQFWKHGLTFEADGLLWFSPKWGDVVFLDTAIISGASSFLCDFTLTDPSLGQVSMVVHPDGSYQRINCDIDLRTDTSMPLLAQTFTQNFPVGSYWVPMESVFIQSNPSYTEDVSATALVSIQMDAQIHKAVTGYGAAVLATYGGRPVLDRNAEFTGANEAFAQKITRLDYGGKVKILSGESHAHSILARQYLYSSPADRQWWKLFLSTVRGQQGSFYTPTYRQDMELVTQPAQASSTMIVDDASQPAGGWENLDGHKDLAIFTADGDVQYVAIDAPTTVDNADGTHTVGFAPALTNTPLGSTIQKISFLELVRLANDTVTVDHYSTHRDLTLTTRSIRL